MSDEKDNVLSNLERAVRELCQQGVTSSQFKAALEKGMGPVKYSELVQDIKSSQPKERGW